jgi:hypothetical protein
MTVPKLKFLYFKKNELANYLTVFSKFQWNTIGTELIQLEIYHNMNLYIKREKTLPRGSQMVTTRIYKQQILTIYIMPSVESIKRERLHTRRK